MAENEDENPTQHQLLSPAQIEIITRALIARGAGETPCPRCRYADFHVEDGLALPILHSNYRELLLGGSTIPSVITACNRCGFIALHALGALGLLDNEEFDAAALTNEEGPTS